MCRTVGIKHYSRKLDGNKFVLATAVSASHYPEKAKRRRKCVCERDSGQLEVEAPMSDLLKGRSSEGFGECKHFLRNFKTFNELMRVI